MAALVRFRADGRHMKYQCPVCPYDQMLDPPEDFNICPSCGVEFGNDDFDASISELRQRWIDNGMRWFSEYTRPPADWNPYCANA